MRTQLRCASVVCSLFTLAVLPSGALHADWSFTLQAAGGNGTCAVLEPFSYNVSACEFVAQLSNRASSRAELWSDALVQSAVNFGNACNRPYQHFLWLDGAIYRLPDTAFVQHQRAALGIAALNLANCQRTGGAPVVSAGPVRLLAGNAEIALSGAAFWFFDDPAKRAYLRVSSLTGDVSCGGAQLTPILGDVIFLDGIELE